MKTLETERLILRKWQETDLNDFYEYASVEGVGEMAGWPHHQDIETSKRILSGFIEGCEVYAMVLKSEDKVIGSLGIHDRLPDPEYKADVQREIGYVLSRDYWGQGFVPEAVREVIRYAFEDIGADVLWCAHFMENNQSRRVIEKSGFKYYRDGKRESKPLDKIFNEKQYIITKNDYEHIRSGAN